MAESAALLPLVARRGMREEARAAAGEARAAYTPFEGDARTKRAMARAMAAALRVDAVPHAAQTVVTNGATAGLEAAAMAVCDANEGVLLPTPRYPSLALDVGARAGVHAVYADALTPEGLRDAIQNAECTVRAVLLTSPDNPTGMWRTQEELDAVLDLVHERGMYLIWDMVYAGTSVTAPIMPPLDDPHVISVYSLSKDFGLSGWRVGAVHTSNADVYKAIEVQSRFTCASNVAQAMANALIGEDDDALREYFADATRTLAARRRAARAVLADAGLPDSFAPHAGPLELVHLPCKSDDGTALWRAILEKGVVVVPGATCGAPTDTVRVCWGACTSDEDAADAARRIADAWRSLL